MKCFIWESGFGFVCLAATHALWKLLKAMAMHCGHTQEVNWNYVHATLNWLLHNNCHEPLLVSSLYGEISDVLIIY